MNARTLKETLDEYGFETEKVVDGLLDVFIKQQMSDHGVLAEDVSGFTGILLGYHLVEKIPWDKSLFFRCTTRGRRIAEELVSEKVPAVFEKFSQLSLEGTYLVLKYLPHLVSQARTSPSSRPELKLLSSLEVIRDAASLVGTSLLENGLARRMPRPGSEVDVVVTLPDLYDYFDSYYRKEKRILSFEDQLESVSRSLNLFKLLYFYEPKAERIYLGKLKEYDFTLEDLSGVLEEMKKGDVISYTTNPLLFNIEKRDAYRKFLKERVLSKILGEFALPSSASSLAQVQTNPQAYALLSEFEEEFRTFLEEVLSGTGRLEERVPPDVVERLQERQEDARVRRKRVYSLLHYTDFPNYLSIILHRTDKFSNWDVFEPHFVSIGWIKGRLIEMNEIRNDLAHPKPLESLQYRKLQLYVEEIRERMRR